MLRRSHGPNAGASFWAWARSRTLVRGPSSPFPGVPAVPPDELRRARDAKVRGNARLLAGAFAIVFVVMAVGNVLVRPHIAWEAMMRISVATALLFVAAWLHLRRRPVPEGRGHVVVSLLASLVLANVILTLVLSRDPATSGNVVLFEFLVAFFVLSWGWMSLLLGAALAAWMGVALTSPPDPGWADVTLGLFSGSVIACLIHAVRLRSHDKVETLLAQEARRREELAAINRDLEAFAHAVSHDLKAPVRAVDHLSQALLEEHQARLGPVGREDLRRLRSESARMGHLIEDLLRLSLAARGELQRKSVDLSALAREVEAARREREPGRAVEMRIQDGVVAEGDVGLLTVVLENLLGNAWKYSSSTQGARVEFGETQVDGVRAYFVRDNGAGFDPARAGELFQPFQRLHGKDFEGTGIGLSTVQRIIARHGGRVWAESPGPGKGATFWFTL